MDEFNQQPFGDAEFAENPEQRCPVVLLLDTSYSMSGAPISELNEGLDTLRHDISNDPMASKRVELALITFGPVEIKSEFVPIEQFYSDPLKANGATPMGEAIEMGLDLLQQRKTSYRQNGLKYYRPWVFLITDGAPTDDIISATDRVHHGEDNREFVFYAVGVEDADMDTLKQISKREPLKLRGLAFKELFRWLSSSLSAVSHSNPGEAVRLESPNGWGIIE